MASAAHAFSPLHECPHGEVMDMIVASAMVAGDGVGNGSGPARDRTAPGGRGALGIAPTAQSAVSQAALPASGPRSTSIVRHLRRSSDVARPADWAVGEQRGCTHMQTRLSALQPWGQRPWRLGSGRIGRAIRATTAANISLTVPHAPEPRWSGVASLAWRGLPNLPFVPRKRGTDHRAAHAFSVGSGSLRRLSFRATAVAPSLGFPPRFRGGFPYRNPADSKA